jgi:beta-lactamase regulating signal transducer with metallopeptidase domain
MSTLVTLYPGDHPSLILGLVLLNSTLLIALAWLAARLLAFHRAAVRHGIWFWTLQAVLLSPMLSVGLDRCGLTFGLSPFPRSFWYPSPGATLNQSVGTVAAVEPRASWRPPIKPDGSSGVTAEDPPPRDPNALAQTDRIRTAAACVLSIWMLGSAFLLLRIAHACVLLIRLKASGRRDDSGLLYPVLDQVRATLGVVNLSPVMITDRIKQPVAAGLFRPLVFLPDGLVGSMGAEGLHDVLVHEYAHVLRRDHLVGLLQRLAELVLWPHPLIHVLNRELARAREEICDNFVLAAGDRTAYAWTLLEIAEAARPDTRTPALGLFQTCWRLEDRIAGLLNGRRDLMTRVNRRTTAVIATTFLAMGTATAGFLPIAEETMTIEQVKATLKEQRAKIQSLDVEYRKDFKPLAAPELLEKLGLVGGPESLDREAFKGKKRYHQIGDDYVLIIGDDLMSKRHAGYTWVANPNYDHFRGVEYLPLVGLYDMGPIAQGANPTIFRPSLLPEALELAPYRIRAISDRVDGDECVVLEGPSDTFWLDTRHGLAVRRRERMQEGHLVSREVNSRLKEVIPGLWLPQECLVEMAPIRDNAKEHLDKPLMAMRLRVTKMSVNSVKDDLFEIDPNDANQDLRKKD